MLVGQKCKRLISAIALLFCVIFTLLVDLITTLPSQRSYLTSWALQKKCRIGSEVFKAMPTLQNLILITNIVRGQKLRNSTDSSATYF